MVCFNVLQEFLKIVAFSCLQSLAAMAASSDFSLFAVASTVPLRALSSTSSSFTASPWLIPVDSSFQVVVVEAPPGLENEDPKLAENEALVAKLLSKPREWYRLAEVFKNLVEEDDNEPEEDNEPEPEYQEAAEVQRTEYHVLASQPYKPERRICRTYNSDGMPYTFEEYVRFCGNIYWAVDLWSKSTPVYSTTRWYRV